MSQMKTFHHQGRKLRSWILRQKSCRPLDSPVWLQLSILLSEGLITCEWLQTHTHPDTWNFFLNLNKFECCCKMFSNSDLCFGPCSTWAGVQQCLLVSSFDQFLQHDNCVGKGNASRIWPGLLDTLYPNLKGVAQLPRKLALVCERAFAIRLRPPVKNLHFVEFWVW